MSRLSSVILADAISFYQDEPPPLVRLQKEHWDPLLDWVRAEFDIEIITSYSVLFSSQPEASKQKLDHIMSGFDRWQMAGQYYTPLAMSYSKSSILILLLLLAMERVTYTTKSFLIALALVHKRLTAEQAALAAQVEVSSQIERWGEVEDCTNISSSIEHRVYPNRLFYSS